MSSKASKREREFQEMVAKAVTNARARQNDKHRSSKAFFAEHAKTFKSSVSSIPSGGSAAGVCAKKDITDSRWKRPHRDDEELERREALAQQKVAEKAARVAPLYSKGPVQYVTDGADLTTLGRKI